MIIKRPLAVLLAILIAAPGCATARGPRVDPAAAATRSTADRAALADYVKRLPPGSPLRIDLAGGRVMRATLLQTSDAGLIVQKRTRIPEPPVDIPFEDVLRVTLDTPGGNGIAKAIGIGIAAGAGAALAVFMIIVALIDD